MKKKERRFDLRLSKEEKNELERLAQFRKTTKQSLEKLDSFGRF